MKNSFKRFLNLYKVMKKARLAAKESSKSKGIIAGIIMTIAMIPFVLLWFGALSTAYDFLDTIGKTDLLIVFGLGVGCFWLFFFNILRIMGSFYFADDIKSYLHLPVQAHEILLAKFFTLLKLSYMILGVVLAPALVVYAMKNISATIIIYTIVGFLGIPIVTLVMTSILVMLIMSSSKRFHNKDLFKGLAGVMSLAIGIGVNIWLRSNNVLGSESAIVTLIRSFESKYSWIEYIPDMRLLKAALVNHANISGVLYMVGFIVTIFIAILLFIVVAKKLYLGGLVNLSEVQKSKNKKNNKTTKSKSILESYTLYERRRVMRNPNFFISMVLNGFIWTAFIIVYSILDGDISSFRSFFESESGLGIQYLIVMAIITFAIAGNPLFTTSISRGGKSIFAEKYLPIDLKDQLKGKMRVNMEILGLIILCYSAVVYYLSLNILFSLAIIPSSLLMVLAMNYRGMEIDLSSPRLYWENEQELRKSNFSGLGMILIFEFFTGIALLLAYIASLTIGLNLIFAMLIFFIIYGVMIYYHRNKFYKYSIERFKEILKEEIE